MVDENSRTLIKALTNPGVYDYSPPRVEVVETHISWVILTGEYAYKIKKPVDLGFLDYTSLEKRRFFCEEELRLNRRHAPDIYIDVVPVTGSFSAPKIGGEGRPIEYAVRMVEFPQEALLDRVIKRGGLGREHIDSLARQIAAFHGSVKTAGADSPFGSPEMVRRPVEQNFEQMAGRITGAGDIAHLNRLRLWADREFSARREEMELRKKNGFIREIHGDMHLGNMALRNGDVLIFDCIEFNESLRWIDVISEIAFLIMDLEDHNRPDLGRRFLNGYLETTGDYEGLALLSYYKSYRAMVRAKVACFGLDREGLGKRERDEIARLYREYFSIAERYARPRHPILIITHGVSGSGKTSITQDLLEETGAVRIRSDVERKRLFGLAARERSGSSLGEGMYTPEANRLTYDRLAGLAGHIIRSGRPVIVDAAFLKQAEREAFRELAAELNIPFAILDFKADEAALKERVIKRGAEGKDASEATWPVVRMQMENREPLTEYERSCAVTVNTNKTVSVKDISLASLWSQPV